MLFYIKISKIHLVCCGIFFKIRLWVGHLYFAFLNQRDPFSGVLVSSSGVTESNRELLFQDKSSRFHRLKQDVSRSRFSTAAQISILPPPCFTARVIFPLKCWRSIAADVPSGPYLYSVLSSRDPEIIKRLTVGHRCCSSYYNSITVFKTGLNLFLFRSSSFLSAVTQVLFKCFLYSHSLFNKEI